MLPDTSDQTERANRRTLETLPRELPTKHPLEPKQRRLAFQSTSMLTHFRSSLQETNCFAVRVEARFSRKMTDFHSLSS